MAKKSKAALKDKFKTGDKPTQSDFGDLIDSMKHEDDNPDLSNYAFSNQIPTDVSQLNDSLGILSSQNALRLPNNNNLIDSDIDLLIGLDNDGKYKVYQPHSSGQEEYSDMIPIGKLKGVDAQYIYVSQAQFQKFDVDNINGDVEQEDVRNCIEVMGGKNGMVKIRKKGKGVYLGRVVKVEGSESIRPYTVLVKMDVMGGSYSEEQYAEPGYFPADYVE